MKKHFFTFITMMGLCCFTPNVVLSQTMSVEWWYVQHRTYEDGREFNVAHFSMKDANDNYVPEDVLSSIQLYDPDNAEVTLSTAEFGGAYQTAYGNYDADNGRWHFGDPLDESYYRVEFGGDLKSGQYHLVVTDKSGNQYDAYRGFTSVKELPMISSESFCAYWDGDGNLFWKWEIPTYYFSPESTSIRTWVSVNDNGVYLGDVYLRIPTHMGWAVAPADLLTKFGGNEYFIGVHVRTNDNNNRTYSRTINSEEAKACNCDINADQKTGLQEAIHALKIVAGIK